VHVAGTVARIFEERGLADARFAAQDKDTAPRGTSRLEQTSDLGSLDVTPVEHAEIVMRPAPGPKKSGDLTDATRGVNR
jgi:hypothetical protein